MAGASILSDDFWLLGPSFGAAQTVGDGPEYVEVESVRPHLVAATNMRPTMENVVEAEGAYQDPPAVITEELVPRVSTTNLRPRITGVREE